MSDIRRLGLYGNMLFVYMLQVTFNTIGKAIYTYVYNVYNVSFERITCFTFVNTVIRKHVGEVE